MLHLDHHVPRARVFMMQGVVDVVHGGVRHALPLEHLEPLLRCFLYRDSLDGGLKLGAVRDAGSVHGVPRVRLPLGAAQAVAEDAEEPVVAAAEEHVAVFGLEGLVRHDRGCVAGD